MERAFVGLNLLLLLFLPAQLVSQERGSPIVCWNVENYFDIYDNPDTADDEFTPMGEKYWNSRKFRTKRNAIAKTILSIKDSYGAYPFLVGMVEVENSYVLKELITDTPLSKLKYRYIHKDSHDPRGIECALLYREGYFTPVETKNIKVERVYPDKPIRHILYTKGVETATGDTIHIFVNHWSSKLGGAERSEPNRLASALKLVSVVDSIYSAQGGDHPNIIIMGDFNDTYDSRPLNALHLSKASLFNLSEDLSRRGEGTIKYKGEWELIDHFIVSSPLKNMEMEIYSPAFLLEADHQFLSTKPARTYSGPRYLGGVSDHLPIILHKK